mgnify:CR=1 FL=1
MTSFWGNKTPYIRFGIIIKYVISTCMLLPCAVTNPQTMLSPCVPKPLHQRKLSCEPQNEKIITIKNESFPSQIFSTTIDGGTIAQLIMHVFNSPDSRWSSNLWILPSLNFCPVFNNFIAPLCWAGPHHTNWSLQTKSCLLLNMT